MTFGNFIKTMSTAKTSDGTHIFRYRRDELGVKILNAAGIVIESGDQDFETTITKWIDRKVPKNILTYFPDEKINGDEVISFFNRWTRDMWQDLQTEFGKAATGRSNVVDCETKDSNEFYQSLCDQLSKSLGLPLPGDPTGPSFLRNLSMLSTNVYNPSKKRKNK